MSIVDGFIFIASGFFGLYLIKGVLSGNPQGQSALERRFPMVRNKKLLWAITIFLWVYGTAIVVNNSVGAKTDTKAPSMKDPRILQRMAEEANKRLPMMADADTRVDYISTEPQTLIYHITVVNFKAADINKVTLMSTMGNALYASACSNPAYVKVLNENISLRMDYYAADKVKIGSVLIPPSLCKKR